MRGLLRRLRDRARQVGALAPLVAVVDRAALRWTARERFDGQDPEERRYVARYAALVCPATHGRVLDLGCGHGYLTIEIASRAEVREVVGIDRITDFRCPHPKVRYLTQDVIRTPTLPGGFDVVVATEFIEHLPEAALLALLPHVRGALREGGAFVGSTPPNPTDAPTFSGSPFHHREYQPEILAGHLRRHFEAVEIGERGPDLMVWTARRQSGRSDAAPAGIA